MCQDVKFLSIYIYIYIFFFFFFFSINKKKSTLRHFPRIHAGLKCVDGVSNR